ncbi:MAG: hypothetical protein IT236_07650 [Bacteroidia bacterium]|nr:hypothetical protein [Bacteroidia bacterium]
MKKITMLAACLIMLGASSCKKDRDCVCTTTNTSTSGAVTTYPEQTTTLTKIKKGDAKSLCQKSTNVNVDSNNKTSTTVNDCKLK